MNKSIATLVIAIVSLFTVFVVGLSTYYTIDEGERGVILRNGRVIGIAEPGLHFKTPFIDSVYEISVRAHARKFTGAGYTKDQQTTAFQISVNYEIPIAKVQELYTRYQNAENMNTRLLERIVPTQVKNVLGGYNAHLAIQEREKLIAKIEDAIIEDVKNEPIRILSVQVEDIEFSKAYEKSIEDRMKAEVEVATQRQNLEKEKVAAEINITKARAEAEATYAKAEAEAKGIKAKGDAEVEVIKAKAQALQSNPNIIQLTVAEKWKGELPQTMLPNSSLPMIQLPNGSTK